MFEICSSRKQSIARVYFPSRLVVASTSPRTATLRTVLARAGGNARPTVPPCCFTSPIIVMTVCTGASRTFCTSFQRQSRSFVRQKSLLTQLLRRHAAQGLCLNANRMPFLRYARGSRAAAVRPRPGLPHEPLHAGANRHGMSLLSSKH